MTDFTRWNLLSRLRDEVPLAEPSPNAQRAFRARLTATANARAEPDPRTWPGARASIAPPPAGSPFSRARPPLPSA